jgi:effector-binding domain-containing protein
MPTQEVVIKKVPAQLVASVRDVIPIQAISGLFDELFGHLGRHGAGPAGPPIGIYHSEEFREEGNDTEIAAPVASTIPDGERVGCRELPAIDAAACVIHEGGYETIGGSYGRLMGWVEAHGYRIAGPVREIYLRGPESGDPAGYVTEIQLPVAEA